QGIKVTTSSNYTPQYWTHTASGESTIDGIGLDGPMMEASRFLSQATLGGNLNEMRRVVEVGIPQWIEEQMALPPTRMYDSMVEVYAELVEWYLLNGGDPEELPMRPNWTA